MPGIEFWKDWDPKKHGWPALIVAVLFTGYELFVPKDPSCTKANIYLQSVVDRQDKTIRLKDSLNFELERDLLQAKRTIKKTDSAYHEVIEPYKPILKSK